MRVSRTIKVLSTLALAGALLGVLAGCSGSKQIQIAVPSDPTNEARALVLLQDQGLIKLKDGVGLSATKNDIIDNPHHIDIVEAEAASLPRTLQDVDAAVINANYALGAHLDTSKAFASESADSSAAQQYANVVAVRPGDEQTDKTKALVAALQSEKARQFIKDTYHGFIVPLGSGDDLPIPDAPAGGETIKVGASPTPHAEILGSIKDLLAKHGYKLDIVEYSDYIQPNVALASGDLDANYFQHIAYLDNYNSENGTKLANAGKVHFEPLGLYGGKAKSLDDLKK